MTRRRRSARAEQAQFNRTARELRAAAERAENGWLETVAHMGRKFDCRAFNNDDAANRFMERENYGVILVRGSTVYCAHMKDEALPTDRSHASGAGQPCKLYNSNPRLSVYLGTVTTTRNEET